MFAMTHDVFGKGIRDYDEPEDAEGDNKPRDRKRRNKAWSPVLDQLKHHTTVVADTGDFKSEFFLLEF